MVLIVLTTAPGGAQVPGRGYSPLDPRVLPEPVLQVREEPIPYPGPMPRGRQPVDSPRLPKPVKSGKIPAECQALAQSPSGVIVDCWLEHHVNVRNVIRWRFSKTDGRFWQDWPEWAKQDLREAFVAAREWKK